jgi:hypothetical protein
VIVGVVEVGITGVSKTLMPKQLFGTGVKTVQAKFLDDRGGFMLTIEGANGGLIIGGCSTGRNGRDNSWLLRKQDGASMILAETVP